MIKVGRLPYWFLLAVVAVFISGGKDGFGKTSSLRPAILGSESQLGLPYLDEEINKWEKILQKQEEYVPAHFHLGLLYWQNNNFEKARFHLERIESIDPGNKEAEILDRLLI